MAKQKKFGTFGGVFTPSILTILGVIMYLRLPMIVGQAGFWATLGIILVAHIISITTGLSVSSIATDKKVESGGTYFMISRSLGLPIGGTLGVALFIGLSFSVSLYLIGFSESFLNFWDLDSGINNIRLTGSVILLAISVLTFISTSLAIKTQYFIMGAIFLSLVSIFFGKHEIFPEAGLSESPVSSVPLMVLFGIFFPAVTGFEAGVSMSGDLKNPKRSIPIGAILAILTGLIVYIGLAGFLSATVDRESLAHDSNILLKISWIPELVVAGIWGATLSSALGSILGAPRILQATAMDSITPKFFARGYGATNEPRNALLLTFLIAESGILIGELDVIARVVSIFFITTYGFLNTSAAFESWTSADFRPEFRVPGWISATGAVACILVMIQLDFLAMVGAIIILGMLFLYLKRKELTLDSGDAWSGVWASLVRAGLTRLKADAIHSRNWRPNIIMFSGNPELRKHLVDMGKAISGKLGVLSAFELVPGPEGQFTRTQSVLEKEKDSTGYFHHRLYCQDVFQGMEEVARLYGFSGVEPNTILMGWSKNDKTLEKFTGIIRNFKAYGYNSLFLNYNPEKKYGLRHSIDIWWSGTGRNLSFAINLVRHITYSRLWRSSKIRVLVINPVNETHDVIHKSLKAILENYRLEAEIKIINNQFTRHPEYRIITTESAGSDLVILGISEKKFRVIDQHADEITSLISNLGTSLIIHASGNFENLDVMEANADKHYLDDPVEPGQFSLPELNLSGHEEIAADIRLTNIHMEKIIDIFYSKSFRNLYLDRMKFLDELEEITDYLSREIGHLAEIRESFRRKKAIERLKNETNFKLNEIISDELIKEKLPLNRDQLRDGLGWYVDKLESDFKRYPKNLVITYTPEKFLIKPEDPFGLKWGKRFKKVRNRLTGAPIRHSISYREVVRPFLLNSRLVFLTGFLEKFMGEEDSFFHALRHLIGKMTGDLDEVERKIWNQETGWDDPLLMTDLKAVVSELKNSQKKKMRLNVGRIHLETKKNLQELNDELSRLAGFRGNRKKQMSRKKFLLLKKKISDFDENYYLNAENHLNKLLMEFSVNSIKNRIKGLHAEFILGLKHYINLHYFRELERISAQLQSPGKKLPEEELELRPEFEIELKDTFEKNVSRMRDLVRQMKDHFDIQSGENAGNLQNLETVSIPLAKMTEHYLETRYIAVMEDYHEDLLDKIKRSVFIIQDTINLTRFNLENYQTEGQGIYSEIMDSCIQKIEDEKNKTAATLDVYLRESGESLNKIFEPLSSLKIEESADHFLFGLSTYQGKRVLSSVSSMAQHYRSMGQKALTKLMYVRSEGILLSKKYTEDRSLRSYTSRLLDLKEKVNPDENILKALPTFYTSLFNGKSSISDDYWIERKEEEIKFGRAVDRYQHGHRGGILILGNRNMGKTAFCKYVSQVYLDGRSVYTLFPSLAGSVSPDVFTDILSKASQGHGDIFQVAGQLKENSVIIINDLELFWERSAEGMSIISLIEQLIDAFSQKLLFIINLNPHAYKVINQLSRFGEHFIEIINLKPFDAEEIRDLIMVRHRSSGMTFDFSKNFANINEVRMAQLFNAYFNYSSGNPGAALNGWLSHIKKIMPGKMIIEKPANPSLSVIRSLDEQWIMLLTQFILHKRLDAAKISRITGWSQAEINGTILAMLRSGLIVEKVTGLYMIDPYLHPFAVKALEDMNLL